MTDHAMTCMCGGRLPVRRTFPNAAGGVERERVCLSCGRRYLTRETAVSMRPPTPRPKKGRAYAFTAPAIEARAKEDELEAFLNG